MSVHKTCLVCSGTHDKALLSASRCTPVLLRHVTPLLLGVRPSVRQPVSCQLVAFNASSAVLFYRSHRSS